MMHFLFLPIVLVIKMRTHYVAEMHFSGMNIRLFYHSMVANDRNEILENPIL